MFSNVEQHFHPYPHTIEIPSALLILPNPRLNPILSYSTSILQILALTPSHPIPPSSQSTHPSHRRSENLSSTNHSLTIQLRLKLIPRLKIRTLMTPHPTQLLTDIMSCMLIRLPPLPFPLHILRLYAILHTNLIIQIPVNTPIEIRASAKRARSGGTTHFGVRRLGAPTRLGDVTCQDVVEVVVHCC